MSVPTEDKSAAGHCAELVRAHDFTRYASTLFVPASERRALLALYAFDVEISRIHSQVSQPLPGEIRLQWWTEMLAGDGRGGGGDRAARRRARADGVNDARQSRG